MNAQEPEKLFEDYLTLHGLKYQRDLLVSGKGNVDFHIQSDSHTILCDVKEIRDSIQKDDCELNAYINIRNDINKLRKKFGQNRPDLPCVLVSMNFSSSFFTGLTVARAMLGDVGVYFDKESKQIISPVRHLPSGNARMTENQNRTISGVLVFDRAGNYHCLFTNPFAEHPVPDGFFPNVQVVLLTKDSLCSQMQNLPNLIFWNV